MDALFERDELFELWRHYFEDVFRETYRQKLFCVRTVCECRIKLGVLFDIFIHLTLCFPIHWHIYLINNLMVSPFA